MSNFHSSNRRQLKKLVKAKLIVITANVQIQKTLDQPYPFKQDNNFWYLTGIDDPSFVLVMHGNEEFLIAPKLSETQIKFDGSPDLKAVAKTSGIHQILSETEGWQKLAKLLKNNSKVATLVQRSTLFKYLSIYPSPAKKQLAIKLKKLNAKIKFEDITKDLAHLRMVKQPFELARIKKAIKITNDTLSESLDRNSLKSLKTTKELEAVINFGFISRGATSLAFDSIVAQGIDATTIHFTQYGKKLNNKELLLVDVGCEYGHYSSDISRTICIGTPSLRQQAVYDAVMAVQTELFTFVKSGLTFKELERKTEQLIGKVLFELGLITNRTSKEIRRYYPHSVSHSLGLDVHDLADPLEPIPAGSVITIEPGIYIPEESIGVRIEDDVLVTKDGCQVLSKNPDISL